MSHMTSERVVITNGELHPDIKLLADLDLHSALLNDRPLHAQRTLSELSTLAERITNKDRDCKQESKAPLPAPSGGDSMSMRRWHS